MTHTLFPDTPLFRSEPPFQRCPTWMWRNTEIAVLTEWMRGHNEAIADMERRAGFYGLDMYNRRGSIAAVLDYLDRVDPDAAATARERSGWPPPWQKDPATHGRRSEERGVGKEGGSTGGYRG